MSNIEFTLKRGATGSVLETTLLDADDAAFDLTSFSGVTIKAWAGGADVQVAPTSSTTYVIDAACVIGSPATSGVVSYEFDVTTSNIAAGVYNFEFIATDSGGEKYVFPSDKKQPYGILYVKSSSIGT